MHRQTVVAGIARKRTNRDTMQTAGIAWEATFSTYAVMSPQKGIVSRRVLEGM